MKPLVEMCSSLVLLQKFVPEARKNGAFAECLRRSVMTSLLSSSLATATVQTASKSISQRNTESGYLLGMMAEMGTLLLAFYYPQLYDAALKRSEQKAQPLSLSIKQLFGLSPLELSSEIIGALGLPQYYADILRRSEQIANNTPNATAARTEDMNTLSRCLGCAAVTSETINSSTDPVAVKEALERATGQFNVAPDVLQTAVSNLTADLQNHCAAIQLTLPELQLNLAEIVLDKAAAAKFPGASPARAVPGGSPLSAGGPTAAAGGLPQTTREAAAPTQPDAGIEQGDFSAELGDMSRYVKDIREAIKNNDPTYSIITTAMEACAYCLRFSRVVLLLANKERSTLTGRVALGQVPGFVAGKYTRQLSDPAIVKAPDYQAFVLGQTVTTGGAIFKDGHSAAAVPIGTGRRTVGVVYAERTDAASAAKGLSLQEQSALILLASLLDKAVSRGAK
jgi:hypothetical protein